jgi:hypothetical protein
MDKPTTIISEMISDTLQHDEIFRTYTIRHGGKLSRPDTGIVIRGTDGGTQHRTYLRKHDVSSHEKCKV